MKHNMKKIISLVLVLAMTLAISVPGFAQTSSVNKQNRKAEITSGLISTEDSKTQVSKVMTYDEIVAEIARDCNISRVEAARQVKDNTIKTSAVKADRPTYRTISATVPVFSNYQPTAKFYCQTSESGSFHGIVQILNVTLNRVYNGTAKQFSGTLYTNLEDANTIYWVLNGDFYNFGTTTVQGGGSIGVGGFSTLDFGVSYASSWFGTAYYEHRTTW